MVVKAVNNGTWGYYRVDIFSVLLLIGFTLLIETLTVYVYLRYKKKIVLEDAPVLTVIVLSANVLTGLVGFMVGFLWSWA